MVTVVGLAMAYGVVGRIGDGHRATMFAPGAFTGTLRHGRPIGLWLNHQRPVEPLAVDATGELQFDDSACGLFFRAAVRPSWAAALLQGTVSRINGVSPGWLKDSEQGYWSNEVFVLTSVEVIEFSLMTETQYPAFRGTAAMVFHNNRVLVGGRRA